jgi:hypothetical protein
MDGMATKKARKSKPSKKDDEVRVRLSEEQKVRFNQAAERDGLEGNLSAWLRQVATRAAEESEARAAKK